MAMMTPSTLFVGSCDKSGDLKGALCKNFISDMTSTYYVAELATKVHAC